MFFPVPSKVLALCLLCISIVGADPRLIRRDNEPAPSTSTEVSSTASNTPTSTEGSSTPQGTASSTASPDSTLSLSSSTQSSASSSTPTSATSIYVSAVTSNINGPVATAIVNNNGFNSTLTPNQLPLTPAITPGLAVGGVILLITGMIYTVVGIKNKILHIFGSAAYLASLSVTVLIVYVMNPPVSNAIQGAYLVAIVMTGLVLGGAAMVFKELTEGLGCLLGGFCLSMWFLVLKSGGLLTSTGGRSGFIAAFTLVGYATSFSHITRPYGLIILMSFAGATAVVLGIDCFSRAGLKEFWLYLWNLNDNLFPLGATTYPVTRGLRVEIAAIIVIFLAGIVSQLKLWKVIKEKREQRAAERLNDERTMEQEEEKVGKRIETHNNQDRSQWEAVYGDKTAFQSGLNSNRDSGVGTDLESHQKGPVSTITSHKGDEIEMSDMSPTLTTGSGLVTSNKDKDGGTITVRVAQDVAPPTVIDENGNPVEPDERQPGQVSVRSSTSEIMEEESVWVVGADGEARMEKRLSRRSSKRNSGEPEVVPLPFKVPEGDNEEDRSSVATFADHAEAEPKRRPARLTVGSNLLRKLSQRSSTLSLPSPKLRRSSGVRTSSEDLVQSPGIEDDRASSIAATLDGHSDDEDMMSVLSSMPRSPTTMGPLEPSSQSQAGSNPGTPRTPTFKFEKFEPAQPKPALKRESAVTVGTEILELPSGGDKKGKTRENAEEQPPQLPSSPSPKDSAAKEKNSDKPESVAPSQGSMPDSKPASITKDRLPTHISKVVMSYRTNEWAKHLSGAETPDLDELDLQPAEGDVAPVNVEELQQTPESAPVRSASQMSNYSSPAKARSSSSMSRSHSRTETSTSNYQDPILTRSLSQQSLNPPTLTTRGLTHRASNANIPQSIVESPIEEDSASSFASPQKYVPKVVPYSSTSTLISKRDTMLKSKTYHSSTNSVPILASTPEDGLARATPKNSISEIDSPQNLSATPAEEEDDMPLSTRRDLLRQSSLQSMTSPFPPRATPSPSPSRSLLYDKTPNHPRRKSSTSLSMTMSNSPLAREQQLATWRSSVQQDLQTTAPVQRTIERKHSSLWQERQAEERKREMERRRGAERSERFDERMRRGDMLDAHREALRRMQAAANT